VQQNQDSLEMSASSDAVNLVEPGNTGVKTRAEQYAVAGSVINSIPAVCAAEPGVFHPPLFAPYQRCF
jgi:2,4-diaminopentanoate dehydrogenase